MNAIYPEVLIPPEVVISSIVFQFLDAFLLYGVKYYQGVVLPFLKCKHTPGMQKAFSVGSIQSINCQCSD